MYVYFGSTLCIQLRLTRLTLGLHAVLERVTSKHTENSNPCLCMVRVDEDDAAQPQEEEGDHVVDVDVHLVAPR